MPGGDRGLVSWPARSERVPGQHRRHRRHRRAAGLQRVQRAVRQPGRRRGTAGAGRAGGREPRAGRARGRPHRRRRCCVEPVSGAPRYPLLTAADVDRRDRPGGARVGCRDQRQVPLRPVPPRDQRRRRRRGDRRATPTASATCRSPTALAATSRAPEPSTSTAHLAALAAAGYDGYVGLEYKPSGTHRGQPRLAAARPARHPPLTRCHRGRTLQAGPPEPLEINPKRSDPAQVLRRPRGDSHDDSRFHRARHHGRPDGRPPGGAGFDVVGYNRSPAKVAGARRRRRRGRRIRGRRGARRPTWSP